MTDNYLKTLFFFVLFPLVLVIGGCALDEPRKPAAAIPASGSAAEAPPAAIRPAAQPAPQPAPLRPAVSAEPTASPEPREVAIPAESDLWSLLRSGMQLPNDRNRRIEAHLDWFRKHPDYLGRVFDRGRPYLAWIHQQVAARDMPAEISLLPVVESGFNPFAYSHGRAAGLWQFIPGTGKRFGLKQNWWYDGRRDVVAATDAALDYLSLLHDRFDDDWLLALAAYNAGEGNVIKAVRKNRRLGKATDFWSLDLPRETKSYVPKLIALSRIIRAPAEYDLTLPEMPAQVRLALVDTGGQIDLARVADMADLPVKTLYRFNPGFNRWATAPDGPHRLAVPAELADNLQAALDALPAKERLSWVRHRIRSGQTLSHIARDYHTSIALLKDVNGLGKNGIIRAGQYLLIPRASRDLDQYSLSSVQREKHRLAAGGDSGKIHQVRPGDTLWDIARAYQVNIRSLPAGTAWRRVIR